MTLVPILSILAAAVPAYLAGAIPFGLVLGRALRGVDIREHGSRNLGATNAFRVLGAPIGAAVFALDFAKGFLPAVAAQKFAAPVGFHVAAAIGHAAAEAGPGGQAGPGLDAWAGLAAALAAVLGHVFPVYLGFRGGKGVATGAGVLAALAPVPTAVAFAVFVATVAVTRYVSLGSLLASVTLPAVAAGTGERLPSLICALAVTGIVFVRHRANIGRLVAGNEPRLGVNPDNAREATQETTQNPGSGSSPIKVGP